MGTERSAFHSGPEDFPPTKAVSIRVDPICHSHFSLATRRRTIHSGSLTTRKVFSTPHHQADHSQGTWLNYYSRLYSALACFRIGMSASASFQRVRKS